MKNILKKLSSRKLWAMLLGVASGLGMVFGLDENLIADVMGGVIALAGIVSYIVTEGKIDAAGVKAALEAAEEALKDEDKREGN